MTCYLNAIAEVDMQVKTGDSVALTFPFKDILENPIDKTGSTYSFEYWFTTDMSGPADGALPIDNTNIATGILIVYDFDTLPAGIYYCRFRDTGLPKTYVNLKLVVSDTYALGSAGTCCGPIITGSGEIIVKDGDEYIVINEMGTTIVGTPGGGDEWGDPVDANIIPDADGTRDLGSSLNRFDETYTDDLEVTNDIVVGGTVDGVDISTLDASVSSHVSDTANPHSVTQSQVGLGNVDNTSDVDKPVSTAQQAALDLKADDATLAAHLLDISNPHSVSKSQVGLGNVDNTSDLDKPVSTAQQTALDGKATTAQGALADSALQPGDIDDTAYGVSWDGNNDAATKNAIYDKIETIGGGGSSAANLLHVRHTETSGTFGGGVSAGANTRTINTVVENNITGASLSSDQITLPAGTYTIDADVISYKTLGARMYLYDTTNTATLVYGMVEKSDNSVDTTNSCKLYGSFTLAGEADIEIRHYAETAKTTNGMGYALNDGSDEIFLDARIWEGTPALSVSRPALWSPLLDEKAVADTEDDNFEGGAISGEWTVVSGTPGTVDLLETGNVDTYDVSTRPGWLLAQIGNNGSQYLYLRQDYTLADGESAIIAFAPSYPLFGNSVPSFGVGDWGVYFYLNDTDTGPQDGDFISFTLGIPTDDVFHLIVTESNGGVTSVSAGRDQIFPGGLVYFRYTRSGSNLYTFFSQNGGASWIQLGNSSNTNGAWNWNSYTNIWLTVRNPNAFEHDTLVPIQAIQFFRLGSNQLDPW